MARYSIKRGGYVTLRRGRYYRGRRIGSFMPAAAFSTRRRRTYVYRRNTKLGYYRPKGYRYRR